MYGVAILVGMNLISDAAIEQPDSQNESRGHYHRGLAVYRRGVF